MPAVSVAVHETVVVPSGKGPAGLQLAVTAPQLSVALATGVALAPGGPAHAFVIGAGHVMAGRSVSTTVTLAVHWLDAP